MLKVILLTGIIIVCHGHAISQNKHMHILELNQFRVFRQCDSRHQRECQRKSQQQRKQTLAQFLCPLIHEAPSNLIRFKSVFLPSATAPPFLFALGAKNPFTYFVSRKPQNVARKRRIPKSCTIRQKICRILDILKRHSAKPSNRFVSIAKFCS